MDSRFLVVLGGGISCLLGRSGSSGLRWYHSGWKGQVTSLLLPTEPPLTQYQWATFVGESPGSPTSLQKGDGIGEGGSPSLPYVPHQRAVAGGVCLMTTDRWWKSWLPLRLPWYHPRKERERALSPQGNAEAPRTVSTAAESGGRTWKFQLAGIEVLASRSAFSGTAAAPGGCLVTVWHGWARRLSTRLSVLSVVFGWSREDDLKVFRVGTLILQLAAKYFLRMFFAFLSFCLFACCLHSLALPCCWLLQHPVGVHEGKRRPKDLIITLCPGSSAAPPTFLRYLMFILYMMSRVFSCT